MPLQGTSGAASQDAFGGSGVAVVPNYIEDVFSTYLYTGTGASQTITNGIDLSTKGGLVWLKDRSVGAYDHKLFDTVRGATFVLSSSNTDGQFAQSGLTNFNTNGFSIGSSVTTNASGDNYASWAFREQPKFFDVVTYSGDGIAGKTVAHSLGSVPGCILVKCTSSSGTNWAVYHRSLANTQYLVLNSTAAAATGATWWNSTTPTSAVFSLGTNSTVNASGETFVAYLFAHDAGGFGALGTDNVISCGSYTGNGSTTGPVVTLGYEPQWLLIKNATDSGPNWAMFDNMRGVATGGTEQRLYANTSGAEATTSGDDIDLTATGFAIKTNLGYLNTNGSTYIYIAIRRGPMRVPTDATKVFAPIIYTGTGAGTPPTLTTNFPVDMTMFRDLRTGSLSAMYSQNSAVFDRLRSNQNSISTALTAAEDTTWGNAYLKFDSNTQMVLGTDTSYLNALNANYVNHSFCRAPSFFDEVCYTGTGVARTVTHNLAAVPELVIIKNRTSAYSWQVGALSRTFAKVLSLDQNSAEGSYSNVFDNTDPTASVFSVGTGVTTNGNTNALVAYLFATCAGVSKVFSYTGNGSSQTINCGFTAGSRWVMIKRTDSTGDWYVWDTARGIVAGNDPHLSLNSTAAEVTTDDTIDTDNTGFIVNQVAATNVNVSSATYIGLAIA